MNIPRIQNLPIECALKYALPDSRYSIRGEELIRRYTPYRTKPNIFFYMFHFLSLCFLYAKLFFKCFNLLTNYVSFPRFSHKAVPQSAFRHLSSHGYWHRGWKGDVSRTWEGISLQCWLLGLPSHPGRARAIWPEARVTGIASLRLVIGSAKANTAPPPPMHARNYSILSWVSWF